MKIINGSSNSGNGDGQPDALVEVRYIGGVYHGTTGRLPALFAERGFGTHHDAPIDGCIVTEDYRPVPGHTGSLMLVSSELLHCPMLFRLKERLPEGVSVAQFIAAACDAAAEARRY